MRILTVIHTRWSPALGGPKAQYALSAAWAAAGVRCEKFSHEDAFPDARPPGVKFSARAIEFVRANAGRFDVIDAHQTDLPVPKAELGFGGLLVARSVGLMPMYAEVLGRQDRRYLLTRWGPRMVARRVREMVRPAAARPPDVGPDVLPSLRHADLINVSNQDERRYVAARYGLGGKCVCLPLGLGDDEWAAFAAAARPAAERRAAREVAFVGNWEPRKGSRDWWAIVRRLRAAIPGVRFRFLGTGADRDHVRRAIGQPDGDWLTVVPKYAPGELPGLLAGATVGAFPSYIEGFGFATLEMLAAGLPVVAYDAPGAREMVAPGYRVPAGDARAMAEKLAAVLTAPPAEYETAAAAARAAVEHLRWPAIARDTLALYEERLAAVRGDRSPTPA